MTAALSAWAIPPLCLVAVALVVASGPSWARIRRRERQPVPPNDELARSYRAGAEAYGSGRRARGVELRLVCDAGDLLHTDSLDLHFRAAMALTGTAGDAWVNLVTLGIVTERDGKLVEHPATPLGALAAGIAAGGDASHLCLGTVDVAAYSILIRPRLVMVGDELDVDCERCQAPRFLCECPGGPT